MLGGGRRVHADSKQHMEGPPLPAKRVLSMSLANKNKKPKPAKSAKLETQSHNQTNDVYEGRSHSRAGATNNCVNLTGINNISNSCYANAVVQALRFCPGFREGLDRPCIFPCGNGEQSLLSFLSELFKFMDLADNNSRIVVPSSFMSSLESTFPQFTFGEQHDAQELLKCLLTSLKDTASSQDKAGSRATTAAFENGVAAVKKEAVTTTLLPDLIPVGKATKQLQQQTPPQSGAAALQGKHESRNGELPEKNPSSSVGGGSGLQSTPLAGHSLAAAITRPQPLLHHLPHQAKRITFPGDNHAVQQQLQQVPGLPTPTAAEAVGVSGRAPPNCRESRGTNAFLAAANNSDDDAIGEDLSLEGTVLPLSSSQDPSRDSSGRASESSPAVMSPKPSPAKPLSPVLQQATPPPQPHPLMQGVPSHRTPLRPVPSTAAQFTQASGPLSPPEITERSAALVAQPPAPVCTTKKTAGKARQTTNQGEELLVRIQRKNLKVQLPSKKRRKRPRKSKFAKKKVSVPKHKVKATATHTPYLTITSTIRAPMMVRIPLRLLRGPPASIQHLAGLQRVLNHLPLSPKTPIFDRCFRAKQFPLDSDMLGATDFITRLFEGHLMYGTRCLECEQCTGKEESFLDLSVPIPSESFLGSVNCKFIPLEECIEHFAASEYLSGDNKYFCDECNHLGEAERFIKLSSLPPVLVLHINRFSHNSTLHFIPKYRSQASSKLCSSIVIPETFSLERWCMRKCATKGTVYRLYAVVFHTGISISSGHYTTAVLASVCGPRVTNLHSQQKQNSGGGGGGGVGGDSTNNGKTGSTSQSSGANSCWYYFDDEKVSILEQKHFTKMLSSTSKTPYILFYCSQQE